MPTTPQTLDDAGVLASLGSTGDCFDNALAESFVDSFKTELIADRVWRTHEQAELAIVEWVGWFNHTRLHSSLGDIPPVDFEQLYWAGIGASQPDRSPSAPPPRPEDGLSAPHPAAIHPTMARNGASSAPPPPTVVAPAPGSARPTDSLRQAPSEPEPLSTTLPMKTTEPT